MIAQKMYESIKNSAHESLPTINQGMNVHYSQQGTDDSNPKNQLE